MRRANIASPTVIVDLQEIQAAARRTAEVVRRTPLEHSRRLSAELERGVWLKLECFQTTGSFKIRGAFNRLSLLAPDERQRGILTVSAGNHGLAVAHSAERLGIQASVVVPENASQAKVEAIRRYPVRLLRIGRDYDEAERGALEMSRRSNALFVSPYNDTAVIAGQGTVGLEILEDAAELDALVVPTGGGGLLAGVVAAVKALRPSVRVYGVEPAASPTMTRALEAGRIVEVPQEPTLADGLAGNIEPGAITFEIIRRQVDGMMLVTEDGIRSAIADAARYDHRMIEGSAATALAVLGDKRLKGLKVAAIVTGGNVSLDLFRSIVAGF